MENSHHQVAAPLQETGKNFGEIVFKKVPTEQIMAYELKSRKLRMDSKMVAGNIHSMSRLKLLAEVLPHLHRTLVETDQKEYLDLFP